MTPGLQIADALVAGAGQAARRAAQALLAAQRSEGHWLAELSAESTLEADYILLQLWLHPPREGRWEPPGMERVRAAAEAILKRQLSCGGFRIFPGGPAEINASVKAYCALKLCGFGPDDPRMARLRERVLELGGCQAANAYTKIHLSLFGLYPREHVPTVPPELVLAGNLMYGMSAWVRAILVPLSIVQALGRSRPAPEGFSLEELFLPDANPGFQRRGGPFTWSRFFLAGDRFLKAWEGRGPGRLRRHALRKAEQWLLRRTRYSNGLGAIFPSMMFAVMALEALGYAADHPDRIEAESQLEKLVCGCGGHFHIQPCLSPVRDTATAAFSLGEAGASPSALRRAAEWLIRREVRRKGDWAVRRPGLEPSGWYFEFANEYYPGIDDTALVLLALGHVRGSDRARQRACEARALNWLVHMQSRDGGWAAFDAAGDFKALGGIPFAEENALLDPTCPDITGRVLEALCARGVDPKGDTVRRGVEYLLRAQEQDGSWYGRWGVNYIYGTFLALRGLRAAGQGGREAHILRAGEWLRSIQNADGGWGESCASYQHRAFTPAPSTPSQTAWALLGLLAAGDAYSISVQKGVEYLLETQRDGGAWHEDAATGTGFPKVLYLIHHLYRDAYPLLALATFLKARGTAREDYE